MRSAALLFVPAALIPIASCSLFTSLDGLQGGLDASAPLDAGVDGSKDAAPTDGSPANDAAFDGGTGLLSCNADGLVAYWPFNEGTGVDVNDCHQGLQGVLSAGGVAFGKRGTCADL